MSDRPLLVPIVATGIGILATAAAFSLPRLERNPDRVTDLMSRTIETRGIDAAVAEYRALRQKGFPGLQEREADTNRLGYRLLARGEKESAIQVFRLNVEAHAESANAYDSLGEAYLAAGHKVLAIESYRRAAAIDPDLKSTVVALQKLTDYKRPPYRPMVLFHITAGLLSLVSGALAMTLRKGSRRHGRAGTVFTVSMLSMSASGALIAFLDPKGQALNVLMGGLTFYLVATAWSAARHRSGPPGLFDWAALLLVLAVSAGLVSYGLKAARDGSSGAVYFFFGFVALLAAALDLRRIARGGVDGAQRIARHLWRMCAALFIAVGSLFLGQPQVFPDALRESGLLALPSLLVILLLVFWLIRVLFTNAYRRAASPPPKLIVRQAGS